MQRHAEALLAHLAASGCAPPSEAGFPDDPNSWLPPALEALVAILAEEDPLEPLSRAAQRDQQATALFLCLALAVAGHGTRIHASWLATAFGELSLDRPVTHGQRALWLAAARGAYGPAGKIFVLRRLDALAVHRAADPADWVRALVPGEPGIVIPPSLADYPELAQLPELARPAQAGARLSRLLERCVEITSMREEVAAPLTNGGGAPASAWAEDEPLAVLRSLIGLSGPAGPMASLVSHLLDDLRPGADPHLAIVALHVAAPALKQVANDLAEATRTDPPESIDVPMLGHQIRLRPEGPDANCLEAAERAIALEASADRSAPWPAWLLLATAVACLVATVVTGWLAIPALLCGGLGGWLLWRRQKAAESAARYLEAQLGELRELAEGAVWALHAYAREAEARAMQAAEDAAEVARLVRRGPRAA
ncbi:hypothetical protein [Thermoactinospora rubra]|uniref:hypothetical protein n=1 Tax=Thermoactinospora rubra TaxID=1088767 RepID=UPI000A104A5F|nr:hypothetical protein [Thermoactinospora rubra]